MDDQVAPLFSHISASRAPHVLRSVYFQISHHMCTFIRNSPCSVGLSRSLRGDVTVAQAVFPNSDMDDTVAPSVSGRTASSGAAHTATKIPRLTPRTPRGDSKVKGAAASPRQSRLPTPLSARAKKAGAQEHGEGAESKSDGGGKACGSAIPKSAGTKRQATPRYVLSSGTLKVPAKTDRTARHTEIKPGVYPCQEKSVAKREVNKGNATPLPGRCPDSRFPSSETSKDSAAVESSKKPSDADSAISVPSLPLHLLLGDADCDTRTGPGPSGDDIEW